MMRTLPMLPVSAESLTIPPILHRIWVGGPTPHWVEASWLRWQDHLDANSAFTWQFRYWTEQSIPHSPLARFWEIGRRLDLPPRGQADLLRVAAVAFYGGFYMDADVVPLREFDDLVYTPGVTGWTTSQPESRTQRVLWNGGFAFGAGHPFLADVYEWAENGFRRGARNEHFLAGPRAYREALKRNHDVLTEWTFSFKASAADRRAMAAGEELDLQQLRELHPEQRITHIGVPGGTP